VIVVLLPLHIALAKFHFCKGDRAEEHYSRLCAD
jgi:hypothetical protein